MKSLSMLVGLGVLLMSSVNASALTISPSDCDDNGGALQCWTDSQTVKPWDVDGFEVDTGFGAGDLVNYYKAEVDGAGGIGDGGNAGEEEGSYAVSYATTFNADLSGAPIQFILNTSVIACPECYLLIKDGNQSPGTYIFNIGSWDGTASINLSGFWPSNGAISHIAIWGQQVSSVPAPGTVLLLGIGLCVIGALRRKRQISCAAA